MERLEQYAKEHKIPIMQKDGIEFLCNYIKEKQVKNILEIGSAIGYSAICMAKVAKDIKVTTIERDLNRYQEALNNIDKYQVNNQVTIIQADALQVDLKEKYDLIFIDAAKAQYIKFFEKFQNLLTEDGVIVSDNLEFHGTINQDEATMTKGLRGIVKKLKMYINYLEENKDFETTFYHIGDGISVSKRRKK